MFKEIFTWWNHQTFGTRLYTLFFGKFVGKDENGNKYYESKKGKRWIIYNGEIEATKIPNEWFSWIHFTKNKLENTQEIEKFEWQKSHQPNLTGSKESYRPDKNKNNPEKKYSTWKN
jgi:NADH:ubiquinone oxidoreductase subunit